MEGKSLEELAKLIDTHHVVCPECGKFDWTSPRKFNLLFETTIGIVPENQSLAYLRGETAQGMFVDFPTILQTMRPKLPFGIAQMGKVFRNEITKGKFTFRTLEFDLAEFEFFTRESEWKRWFEYWKQEVERFAIDLGVENRSYDGVLTRATSCLTIPSAPRILNTNFHLDSKNGSRSHIVPTLT